MNLCTYESEEYEDGVGVGVKVLFCQIHYSQEVSQNRLIPKFFFKINWLVAYFQENTKRRRARKGKMSR